VGTAAGRGNASCLARLGRDAGRVWIVGGRLGTFLGDRLLEATSRGA
jgi:hypothetical protein